jgi:hypothetical protein
MATKAQICNLALSHIHQTQTLIANLDTDSGTTAVQCRIHYDVCRLFVLSDHWWNFAKKRVTLAEVGTRPTNWLYRYDYPADCVHFREIERDTRQGQPTPYEIEDDGTDSGLSVVTDRYQAVGVYTRDVKNTSLFSSGFTSALGWYLGSELAPGITGDVKIQEACLKIYNRTYGAAKAANSNEQTTDPELQAPWEIARGSE